MFLDIISHVYLTTFIKNSNFSIGLHDIRNSVRPTNQPTNQSTDSTEWVFCVINYHTIYISASFLCKMSEIRAVTRCSSIPTNKPTNHPTDRIDRVLKTSLRMYICNFLEYLISSSTQIPKIRLRKQVAFILHCCCLVYNRQTDMQLDTDIFGVRKIPHFMKIHTIFQSNLITFLILKA